MGLCGSRAFVGVLGFCPFHILGFSHSFIN